jgi:hypothetical protein
MLPFYFAVRCMANNIVRPNVMIERLTLLLRIREIPGSSILSAQRPANLRLFVDFLVPPGKYRDIT